MHPYSISISNFKEQDEINRPSTFIHLFGHLPHNSSSFLCCIGVGTTSTSWSGAGNIDEATLNQEFISQNLNYYGLAYGCIGCDGKHGHASSSSFLASRPSVFEREPCLHEPMNREPWESRKIYLDD
jgi:hypothetical protein